MEAFNDAISPQEFPDLWERSRFSQRQDAALDKEDQPVPSSEDRRLTDEPQERNRSIAGDGLRVITGRNQAENESDTAGEDNRQLLETEEGIIVKNGPSWLSSALLMREQNQAVADREYINDDASEKWCPVCAASGSQSCMCGMPMHATDRLNTIAPFTNQSTYTHWLSMQGANMHAPQHQPGELDGKLAADFEANLQYSTRMATELNLSPAGNLSTDYSQLKNLRHPAVGSSRYTKDYDIERVEHPTLALYRSLDALQSDWEGATRDWEEARRKALIVAHPLYQELLNAHSASIRVGTPVEQLPHIEAQLAQAENVTKKYYVPNPEQLGMTMDEKVELDQFMTQYIMLLRSFREGMQQHVHCDVTEAMVACWEIEQNLHRLTGASAGASSGSTMSDEDDDDGYDSDYGPYDPNMDPQDVVGNYGPLVPTESERTLMERVRQELKYELKQGYRNKIIDVREEILRKRRAGKLPEGTTTVLKAWWQAHAKWPYPTEDEKEKLIQETGLELKQVNNWFINQRKRNWHANTLSSSSELKSKRKSW